MARITDFDVNAAPEQGDPLGPIIPEGSYVLSMIESDVRLNERTHIVYLDATFEILSVGWQKRKVKVSIPFKMEKGYDIDALSDGQKKHIDIGKAQLGFLVRNLVTDVFDDSTKLHGKPIGARIEIEPGNGTDAKGNPYRDKNRITRFVLTAEVLDTPAPGTAAVSSRPAAKGTRQEPAATPWGAQAPAAVAAPAPGPNPPVAAPAAAPTWVAPAAPAAAPAQVAAPVAAPAPAFVAPTTPPASAPAAASDVPPWARG